jgi:hypothetical protein
MTKVQRMEERIALDDRMCESLNEALDKIQANYKDAPYWIGVLGAVMEQAGRRDGDDTDAGIQRRRGEHPFAGGHIAFAGNLKAS